MRKRKKTISTVNIVKRYKCCSLGRTLIKWDNQRLKNMSMNLKSIKLK